MSATRELAHYLAQVNFDDVPEDVQARARLAVLDTLGVSIGGVGLPDYSERFLNLAKSVGGGISEASIIGEDVKLSLPFAVFANTALATTLDYCDHTGSRGGFCFAWPGALAVPAALAAVEMTGGTGKDLLSAVVAGYECVGRILYSMDMTPEREREVKGETVSVFAAAAAAGRALGLDGDQMLSTLAMAGVQTPVSAGYKWLMDTGLRPRKDIKQGWAWMGLTGAFAARAAHLGLRATQENNILDGERGLWRMLGMDSYAPEQITQNLGTDFVLSRVESKRYPGCSISHTGLQGAVAIVRENGLYLGDIERIEVTTNLRSGIEEDDQHPATAQDMQFSTPYQVGAALSGQARGPYWYSEAREVAMEIAAKTFLLFDDECGRFWEDNYRQMSKVAVMTAGGERYDIRVEDDRRVNTPAELSDKFDEVASQVIGTAATVKLRQAVYDLDHASSVDALVGALSPVAA
jgi:2-methylcitrate dehydratase PrpD